MNDNGKLTLWLTRDGNKHYKRGFEDYSFSPEGGYLASGRGINPNENETGINFKGQLVNTALITFAKGAIDYGLSSYGDITGHTLMQQKISAVNEIGSLVLMAASGPVGFIAAGISVGKKIIDRQIDIAKSETISAVKMERMGLSGGGSR